MTGLLAPPPQQLQEVYLSVPVAYIASFKLNGPAGAYQDFFQELMGHDNWFNYTPGFWIILTRLTLVGIANRLRQKIRTADWLIVMPAKGPADGWLPQNAWEWIYRNVPREW